MSALFYVTGNPLDCLLMSVLSLLTRQASILLSVLEPTRHR